MTGNVPGYGVCKIQETKLIKGLGNCKSHKVRLRWTGLKFHLLSFSYRKFESLSKMFYILLICLEKGHTGKIHTFQTHIKMTTWVNFCDYCRCVTAPVQLVTVGQSLSTAEVWVGEGRHRLRPTQCMEPLQFHPVSIATQTPVWLQSSERRKTLVHC